MGAPVRLEAAPEPGPSSDAPTTVTLPADPPPLRLDLPAGARHSPGAAERHPALDDARATSPRGSVSDRFARSLGSDTTVREERLGDGSLKIRRGNECVRLTPSRNADVDPMDDRSERMPATASGC